MEKLKNEILSMIELQTKLNNNTCGLAWTNGTTNKNRKINWLRCIRMELSELIDSFPWKHWKDINGTIDKANAEVELVDIWHFILSHIIATNSLSKPNINIYVCIINGMKKVDLNKKLCVSTIIEKAEDLQKATFQTSGALEVFEIFITLCNEFGLTFEKLQKLYIGKNALNEFRQLNGYKDGSYIKIWNGSEDNIIMQEILEELDVIDYDKVLDMLESKYSKIKI